MTRNIVLTALFVLHGLLFAQEKIHQLPSRFPADKAREVNPDTHLILTFSSKPTLGTSGQIRIYDAANDRLVDVLDLSIPPGPTIPNRTPAPYTPVPYEYVTRPLHQCQHKTGNSIRQSHCHAG